MDVKHARVSQNGSCFILENLCCDDQEVNKNMVGCFAKIYCWVIIVGNAAKRQARNYRNTVISELSTVLIRFLHVCTSRAHNIRL